MNVLLVEDDNTHAELIQRILRHGLSDGPSVNVLRAPTGHRALSLFDQRPIELVLLDYSLPDRDGLDVLEQIRERNTEVPVIFLTSMDSAEICARAFKGGAVDFVVKNTNYPDVLLAAVTTARVSAPLPFVEEPKFGIVGESSPIVQLRNSVDRAARVASTVLVEGETGTGKELVARAVHERSTRAKRAFVSVNCAEIPETLFESEFFGCVRGAYTGAVSDRAGLLESANGGTLVLDEIEALGLGPQAKLLRTLQSREFKPLGSSRYVRADVRLIAATNEPLERLIDEGRFRRDLFFRLDVLRLRVPALRERLGDIPLLVRHFVRRYNESNGTRFGDFSAEAYAALGRRDWPGNVRELENVVERTLVNSSAPAIDEAALLDPRSAQNAPDERRRILDALSRNRWSREQTAHDLGLSRVTLWRKMCRLGLH